MTDRLIWVPIHLLGQTKERLFSSSLNRPNHLNTNSKTSRGQIHLQLLHRPAPVLLARARRTCVSFFSCRSQSYVHVIAPLFFFKHLHVCTHISPVRIKPLRGGLILSLTSARASASCGLRATRSSRSSRMFGTYSLSYLPAVGKKGVGIFDLLLSRA